MLQDGQKLAYSVPEAVAATPWGKTKLYEMMAAGELKWRMKFGKRYIMREDLLAVLLAQPECQDEALTGRAA